MGAPDFQFLVFTVDCMNDNYTSENKAAFEAQRSLTQRKLSKNLKGRSEPVWPPALESAFLQGLYNHALLYGKQRTARGLKKWTNRNVFISEFILRETNKLRTSKQVGSRIQQLAAATKDSQLLKFRQPQNPSVSNALPRQRFKADEGYNGSTLHHTITVASRSAQYPTLPPRLLLGSPPETIQLRTLMEWQPSTTMIQGMDPTVDLLSPVALAINSMFGLFRGDEPLATTPTALVPDGICDGRFRYIVRIPAVLWQELANRREDNDYCTEWSLRHVVFPANDENLGNIKPFAEVIYNFFEPIVVDAEVQRSPEIPLKIVKNCLRHTSCPPPSLPRRAHSPPRKAHSVPCEPWRPESTLRVRYSTKHQQGP
ncbi:hypothetical protein C8F04DRAFT_701896 [Mycena alexandri]|uniref:TEA domain-containing protein n=1 Tax=Mycena alexandri TaxID=1745969 RepID=A0AAD6SQL5_9AGAR|nr:hypothetical protein C8F04DRAFT_701896 [Mycena alexandri]